MDVQSEYVRFRDESRKRDAPAHFLSFCDLYVEQQLWKSYADLLDLAPFAPGAAVVDMGCKYGHTLPLFLGRGAARAIGVDVEAEYLSVGRRIVGEIYPAASFIQSDRGYLPLPPASVDFVLVNEVISHVNPTMLPTLYGEIARILRRGGQLLISDGNNIANADCARDLIEVYDAWENGPEGRNTGRDVVDGAFINLRKKIIRERHPSLPGERIDYLAANTSGLFGDYLAEVIERFVATGELVERPYCRGICPTNPMASGVVMEWGFRPEAVVMALAGYGLAAREVTPVPPAPAPPPIDTRSLKLLIGTAIANLRFALAKPVPTPGPGWGFQVLAVKEA
jgi:SAM-dependent methyltransferase